MFTIEQIKEAHSKVKSGADFPNFIHEIKKLGVTYFEVFVKDSHTDFYGKNNFKVSGSAKYESLIIAKTLNVKQFKSDLIAHQQGKTNYITFCNDCAKSGIERWIVSIEKMTCTYYDKAQNIILVERIPE
jgi:uncharacterized protein YbcV (DUF1398 family)